MRVAPVFVGEVFFDPERVLLSLYVKSKSAALDFSPTTTLLKIFNEALIPIFAVHYYYEEDKITVHNFLIVDFTNSKYSPAQIEERIRQAFGEYLLDIEWHTSDVTGLAFNPSAFPPTLLIFNREVRTIIFPVTFWRDLIRSLIEHFGTGGLFILWSIGLGVMKFHAPYISKLKSVLTEEEVVKAGLAALQAMGFGIFKLVNFSSEEAVVRIEENFEDLAGCEIPDYQESFVRGILCGFFSAIWGCECECSLTKCTLRGDPYCEVVIRPVREKGFFSK